MTPPSMPPFGASLPSRPTPSSSFSFWCQYRCVFSTRTLHVSIPALSLLSFQTACRSLTFLHIPSPPPLNVSFCARLVSASPPAQCSPQNSGPLIFFFFFLHCDGAAPTSSLVCPFPLHRLTPFPSAKVSRSFSVRDFSGLPSSGFVPSVTSLCP